MSLVQRLMMKILPARWAEDMRADSERWKIRCPSCGHERSIWEIGGIRWRAAGQPRRLWRCRECGKVAWHIIYRKESA